MRTKSSVLLCIAILLLQVPWANANNTPPGNKNRVLTVMTRNLDAGSDFKYVLQAASNPDPLVLLGAIGDTYQEMLDSNLAGRAQGIAAEIQATLPDLVGLQEVTTLRTGPYGYPADSIVVDGLQSLMQALQDRGLHYKAVVVQTNSSIDLPAMDRSYNFFTAGLTDADAVLLRTDLPVSDLQVSNIVKKPFDVILSFSIGGQSVEFSRGWISMQVQQRGKLYKFVTTHLETFDSGVQAAQANELITGPLISEVPVILAGDLNSDANQPSYENGPAFGLLQQAGFQDVWGQLQPQNPGLTWPLFAEDPPGPATPFQRIDLILTRGDRLQNSAIVETGMAPANGAWASDHAGVAGTFILLP